MGLEMFSWHSSFSATCPQIHYVVVQSSKLFFLPWYGKQNCLHKPYENPIHLFIPKCVIIYICIYIHLFEHCLSYICRCCSVHQCLRCWWLHFRWPSWATCGLLAFSFGTIHGSAGFAGETFVFCWQDVTLWVLTIVNINASGFWLFCQEGLAAASL